MFGLNGSACLLFVGNYIRWVVKGVLLGLPEGGERGQSKANASGAEAAAGTGEL